MAHTYTPGLKVVSRTRLNRSRILPLPGRVLVEEGAKVSAETIVARAELPGDVSIVNAVSKLGCTAGELPRYMKKQTGDPVERGELIAETQPWLPFLKTQLTSPIDGTIENVSTVTGQMILRGRPKPVEITAYIDGVVSKVRPGEGVVVETVATFVQGIFGIGGEVAGTLVMACDDPDEELTVEKLRPEHQGQVVVGGSFVSGETLNRAVELGIAAVVVGGFHDHDLRALLGYDLGVAVTGHEQVGITLVMTEGFGRIPMRKRTFELLESRAGSKASVNGATQIRAGVLRPEIVIPWEESEAESGDVAAIPEGQGLEERSQVRIIRQPYFGLLGTVTGLPVEPQQIPTGALARVAEITLEDGRKVLVPRANLERIEE